MSVLTYKGSAINWDYEEIAIKQLEAELQGLDESYLLIANLNVKANERPHGSQIDLLILGNDRIFLVELKDVRDSKGQPQPVKGSDNGQWQRRDGSPIKGQNPDDQIKNAYWNLRGKFSEISSKFMSSNKASQLDEKSFNDIKKFIVLYPSKHPKSEINVSDTALKPTNGDVIGFDQLTSRLRGSDWKSNLPFPIEYDEMRSLAESFDCVPIDSKNPRVKGELNWRWLVVAGFAAIVIIVSYLALTRFNNVTPQVSNDPQADRAVEEKDRGSQTDGITKNSCSDAVDPSQIMNHDIGANITALLNPTEVIKANYNAGWFIHLNDPDHRVSIQIGPIDKEPSSTVMGNFEKYAGEAIKVVGKVDTFDRPNSKFDRRIDLSFGQAETQISPCV